jgi:hypothetical protein
MWLVERQYLPLYALFGIDFIGSLNPTALGYSTFWLHTVAKLISKVKSIYVYSLHLVVAPNV